MQVLNTDIDPKIKPLYVFIEANGRTTGSLSGQTFGIIFFGVKMPVFVSVNRLITYCVPTNLFKPSE